MVKTTSPSAVSIIIYDISGRPIRQIVTNVTNESVPVIWDGKSAAGTEAPARTLSCAGQNRKENWNIKSRKELIAELVCYFLKYYCTQRFHFELVPVFSIDQ